MRKLDSFLIATPTFFALSALIGHATHHPILASALPHTIPMKQLTALLIIEHATATYLLCQPGRTHFKQPLLIIAALSYLMIPGVLSEMRHMENWHSFDPLASFYPSFMTIIGSALLATRILLAVFWPRVWAIGIISWTIALIGAMPFVGYALSIPVLYYFIPGYCTALALPTAASFLLLGLVRPRP